MIKQRLIGLGVGVGVLLVAVVILVIRMWPDTTVSFEAQLYDATAHSITGKVFDYENDMSELRLCLFAAGESGNWETIIPPARLATDGSYVINLEKNIWFGATRRELVLCAVKQEDAGLAYGEMEPLGQNPFTLPALPQLSEVQFDSRNGTVTGSVMNNFTAGAYKVMLFGQNGADWFALAPPTDLEGRSFSIPLAWEDWVTASEKEYALYLVEEEDAVTSYQQAQAYIVSQEGGVIPAPFIPYIATHKYDEATFHVNGVVENLPYPEDFRVVLAIHVNGQKWLKPTLAEYLSPIDSVSRSFSIRAYSPFPTEAERSDKYEADGYTLFLVPASFDGATGVNDTDSVEQVAVHTVSAPRTPPASIMTQETAPDATDETTADPAPASSAPPAPPASSTPPAPPASSTPPAPPASSAPPAPPARSGTPAFDTSTIQYNADNTISGVCTGDVSNCRVILYINVGGQWWVKPTQAQAHTRIDSQTGAFRMNAFSDWPPEAKAGDLTASSFRLYLVEGTPAAELNDYSGQYVDFYEFSR